MILVARAVWNGEDIYDSLCVLVRAATTLRRMMGDMVASNYEVFKIGAGMPFSPERMVDTNDPGKRAERVGARVVGSVTLGLCRYERGPRVDKAGGQVEVKILVKAEVVLDTIAGDLGLLV